mmetsp:Transcript_44695/g.129166  ORF Transcript_44695/g.129166 Transcript_44695/m.129166 type:complete len:254 (+) Transcript_44695:794-1555(+)
MTGIALASPQAAMVAKNLLAKKVTPVWLFGFKSMNLGLAFATAFAMTSGDSSPVQTKAQPPTRSAMGADTASASYITVTPSGKLSPGAHTTPTGTSSNIFTFAAAFSVSAPFTTTASTLFQSFCTSPSWRRRKPKRLQSAFLSKPASSSAVTDDSTEPSAFKGTSRGKLQSLRATGPARRPLGSSKGATPVPTEASATPRKARQGLASNSGSSVRETRTVSPRPSMSKAPMPTADLIRPSAPPPASVTPKWRG